MKIHVMTIFPDWIDYYSNQSILKKAQEKKRVEIFAWDIRKYTSNKHKKVDDYPYGGGAGMIMMAQPIYDCYQAIKEKLDNVETCPVVYLSPKGKIWNQRICQKMASLQEMILLCGHYEGIDQRIIDLIVTDEVSIGDFIVTGGELPALIMIDSITRLIDGVLGSEESTLEESHQMGLLEYPHYTRPKNFIGMQVPDVLLSGNHQRINKWRQQESLAITYKNRPDLID